jgi:predicted DCC family thiol-disulfide oxidoreductase YuxK
MMHLSENDSILLFDGHCKLCSGVVQFVLERDAEGKVKIASLQSKEGKMLLDQLAPGMKIPDSMAFIKNNRISFESEAALRLGSELPGWPSWGKPFLLFPAFLRDAVYRLVARYRYRIWGKTEACFLPDPAWKSRFLDGTLIDANPD